jgi:hypothetical protein
LKSDSITKADGYPYLLAEAWSEQAYPHLVSVYGMSQYYHSGQVKHKLETIKQRWYLPW